MRLKEVLKKKFLTDIIVASGGPGEWRVLVMDALATRIVSSLCTMTDILDCNVSCVEDISKKRQPCRAMAGVYFLAPSQENVTALNRDFAGEGGPLYKDAHVFFTSSVPAPLVEMVKSSPPLLNALRALREANLEITVVDSLSFSTMHPKALQHCFEEGCDASRSYTQCIDHVAMRLSCLFASLGQVPAIRYRSGPVPQEHDPPGQGARVLVAQRVAEALHQRMVALTQAPGSTLPKYDTCDLLVVDRAIDPVGPAVHPWTYEAMAHDLVLGDAVTYEHTVTTAEGPKTRQVAIGEGDPMFADIRHLFISEATNYLGKANADFLQKSKVQSVLGKKGEGAAPKMSDLAAAARALPEFTDFLNRLSLHLDITGKLMKHSQERGLAQVGSLEQDLLLGEASHKEVFALLERLPGLTRDEKVRLLMCYSAAHPDRMDQSKAMQWQSVARITPQDIQVVQNLEFFGVQVSKRGRTALLRFGGRKARTNRPANVQEGQWEHMRVQPVLMDRVQEMAAGTLSREEFPWVAVPVAQARAAGRASGAPLQVQSARVNRGPHSVGWARRARELEAQGGDAASQSSSKPRGRLLVVFMVGGMTHAEMRVAHVLSAQLERDILIGSTSVDCPATYLEKLASLNKAETVAQALLKGLQ